MIILRYNYDNFWTMENILIVEADQFIFLWVLWINCKLNTVSAFCITRDRSSTKTAVPASTFSKLYVYSIFVAYLFCSNSMFLINHALKFKCQPGHLKVNSEWWTYGKNQLYRIFF